MDTDNKAKRRGAENAEKCRVKKLCDPLRPLRLCVSPHLCHPWLNCGFWFMPEKDAALPWPAQAARPEGYGLVKSVNVWITFPKKCCRRRESVREKRCTQG